MRRAGLIAIATVLASCSFDTSNAVDPVDGLTDAAESTIDAGEGFDIDAGVAVKEHLLLSEVSPNGQGLEFIEIHNPTDSAITLTDYYLADTAEYATIPGHFRGDPEPDVGVADFIVKFPDGAQIASGDTQIIALNPAFFPGVFGVTPTYRIQGEPGGAPMERVYQGSIGNFPSITNEGESIILFFWDGETDLVTDIDLVDFGPNTSSANRLANKTGLSVDGPDSGRDASTYQTDMFTMGNIGQSLNAGESFHRILPEEGHERHDVTGNGKFLHDETTEDTSTTWDVRAISPGSPAL